jgi:hypothetical protein
MHVPASHCCAPPQVLPVLPHLHEPVTQLSLFDALQAKQLAPLEPHWVKVGTLMQLLPLQHPAQFELPSQTHEPEPVVTQRWPS